MHRQRQSLHSVTRLHRLFAHHCQPDFYHSLTSNFDFDLTNHYSTSESVNVHSWQLRELWANSFSSPCTYGTPDLPSILACQYVHHRPQYLTAQRGNINRTSRRDQAGITLATLSFNSLTLTLLIHTHLSLIHI